MCSLRVKYVKTCRILRANHVLCGGYLNTLSEG